MAGTNERPGPFGLLLQQYRVAAGLSQEELAEKAGLSRRGISDLERGERRAPRLATVRRLADALDLEGADRVRLLTTVHTGVSSGFWKEPSADESRAAVVAHSDLIPLVGRKGEWQRLQSAWQVAGAGAPGLVVLVGEPGIGKTRLAEELLTWARRNGVGTATARAYAAEGSLSYGPVAEWLRSETLREAVGGLDAHALGAVGRLLPEVLPERVDPELYHGPADSQLRQRFFRSLAQATLSTHRPLLLLLEDLQWCDRDTLEWLHYLLRFDSSAALQVVGTLRTGEVGPRHPLTVLLTDLRRNGLVTEVLLGPLRRSEVAELATAVAGYALDPVELGRLYDDTEGQPLYVVETIRAGLAASDSVSHPITGPSTTAGTSAEVGRLPPKVQALISARLAQLSEEARETACLAATIGRSFTLELLVQASARDIDSLVAPLDELWEREIVRERGANGYDFTHDRIREVAYAEIRPAQRRQLHRRVAEALERANADNLDSVSARLAAHYDQAGLADRAIDFYMHAAEVAQRVYANEEAADLLNRALALFEFVPASLARDERELAARTALGVSLVSTRGYAAAEVLDVYRRSHELSQRLGKSSHPPVLRALAIASASHTDFQQAQDFGDQLLSQAEREHDPVLLVEAHYVLGVTLFWRGQFAAAATHLKDALSLYSPERSHLHLATYAQDPAVVCLIRLAVVLWFLGEWEESTQRAEQSLALARQVSHPFSLCYALAWDALLQTLKRDTQATRHAADAATAISREHGLEMWRAQVGVMRGWAQAEEGHAEAGLEAMQHSMEEVRVRGNLFMRPFFMGLLAEQYARAGRVDEGLFLLDAALADVHRTGEFCWEALLYMRKGTILRLRGDDEARDAFRDAVAVARRTGAKALQLQAASQLALYEI